MKRLVLLALMLCALATAALAQSNPSPPFGYGAIPTAGQWNNYFASKQDYLGYVPFSTQGGTLQGKLWTIGSTITQSGLNIAIGVSPSSPLNGDVWMTSTGLFYQTGGVVYGPVVALPGSTGIMYANGSSPITTFQVGSNVTTSLGSNLGTAGGIGPVVANNTELEALSSTYATSVTRLGFASAGDSGIPILYVSSNSACSLNAGLGDNGYQVQSNDSKCWIASLPADGTDVRVWGAKCDGSTDDHNAINAALAAIGTTLGGGTVLIPAKTCAYGAAIQLPANTRIKGTGYASSILAASLTNIDGIDVNGNRATIEGIEVNCGAAGVNSSGNCVNNPSYSQFLMDNFNIYGAYIGFYTGGSVITLLDGFIGEMTTSTGIGIEVNGGDNQTFTNILCQGTLGTVTSPTQPKTCLDVYATGGMELFQFEAVLAGSTAGAIYEPGTGQTVFAVWDYGGDYDSNQGPAVLFAPTGTGTITSYHSYGQYTSYSYRGVSITGSAGSTIQDVTFIDPRAYINTHDGIFVNSSGTVTGLTVSGGTVCGNGTSSANSYGAITFFSTVTHVNITNNTLGNCNGYTGYSAYGIYSTVNTTNYMNITGNDMTGNATAPALITLAASNATVMNLENNLGIDDQIGGVASATTIAAPLNPQFSVTGTTAVQNITGLWNGRKFVINPTGAIAFGGGSVATSCTSTNAVPVLGFVVGAYAALKC